MPVGEEFCNLIRFADDVNLIDGAQSLFIMLAPADSYPFALFTQPDARDILSTGSELDYAGTPYMIDTTALGAALGIPEPLVWRPPTLATTCTQHNFLDPVNDTAFTVADASLFAPGDVLRDETTEELLYVQNADPGTQTLTVIREWAGSDPAAMDEGHVLTRISWGSITAP